MLSIILNKPSRFDKQNGRILSGPAGDWFLRTLANNKINPAKCYITTTSNIDYNILQESKCILTLGAEALAIFKPDTEVTLNEQRGSPFYHTIGDNQIPVVASYAPQDSFDPRNYEKQFNNVSIDGEELEDDSDKDDDKDTGKAHGKTKRKNYKFWLSKDIEKVGNILQNGLVQHTAQLVIYPSADEVIHELTTTKDKYLFWDIETDPTIDPITEKPVNDITVFSFCFLTLEQILDSTFTTFQVYTVPCRRYNYTKAYDDLGQIFVALAIAMSNNTTVTWNGATFDLFVWTWKYRLPFGIKQYDGMVAHHRNYPDIEKSLGHAISLYTNQPYHKNTSGTFTPWNTAQEMSLWTYNGIDVQSMVFVMRGIERRSREIKSQESIDQANRSIAPYLTMTFQGIAFDSLEAAKHIGLNDRRCNQLLDILQRLVGRPLNPRSNKAMPHYLFGKKHEGGLGLTPVSYSKDTGNPKCDAKALIKLYVKHPHIVSLPVIIQIRRTAKETEALKFTPIDW